LALLNIFHQYGPDDTPDPVALIFTFDSLLPFSGDPLPTEDRQRLEPYNTFIIVFSLFPRLRKHDEGQAGCPAARGRRGLVNNIKNDRKEEYMKKVALMMVVLVMGLSLAAGVFAQDKAAIQKQVDEIVKAIDGGKTAADFESAAQNKPYYVYIMKKDGKLLVHPSLEGKNLKEAAMPAYEAVSKATKDGTWVKYEWKGAEKNAYVRETNNGEIVGSGY
jgi:hypothetical protein